MPPFPGDEAGPRRGGPAGGSAVSRKTGSFGKAPFPSASKGRPLERPKGPETEAGMGTIAGVSKNRFATNVINISHISCTFL